jgi:hypothetical protein
MISEIARDLATVGPVAVTVCGGGIFGLLRLRMRLKFNRYVVDRAADQGQPVDALEIIKITTPGASSRRGPAGGEVPKQNHSQDEGDPPAMP